MNSDKVTPDLIRQLLVESTSTENSPALEPFVRELVKGREDKHISTELDRALLYQKLERIDRLVAGELQSAEIEEANADIATDPRCERYFAQLVTLTKRVDQAYLSFITAPPASQTAQHATPHLQPAWRMRDGRQHNRRVLATPDDFDFDILLIADRLDTIFFTVRGQILPHDKSADLQQFADARAWLLWDGDDQKTTFEPNGVFRLDDIPARSHTLELAWGDEFLEIFDVLIPFPSEAASA